MGLEKVTTLQSLLFLLRNSAVSLNKCFLECCKSLINIQNLEKVDSDKMACFLTAFVEKRPYRGPYASILLMSLKDYN